MASLLQVNQMDAMFGIGDNNRFTDMSFMGIGTNILGYNYKEVDNAVKEVVSIFFNMKTKRKWS